jgi:16S rRNA (cytidine1402-2'-O)-methyltransferase
MGTTRLYVVPTPIGNLGDITLRALEVLKSADRILAEDTRKSGVLLKHFGISKPLQSFHLANEHSSISGIIRRLKSGESMALITDAGTPGISDPGFLLVRACIENDVPVECLPGATAFVPALVKSGLPSDRFTFEGFLPQKKGRQTAVRRVADSDCTVILYESPHRLLKTLDQLIAEAGPTRRVSVSRELTKLHEETYNGTLAGARAYFAAKEVRGEIVIVMNGKED